MATKFEVQGTWRLPNVPEDEAVPGWLTWSVDEGAELRLLRRILEPEWRTETLPDGTEQRVRVIDADSYKDSYPAILGEADGRCYTLLGARSRVIHHMFAADSKEIIGASTVIVGSAWFTEDDVEADRASFSMRHLTRWVGHTGISVSHAWGRGDDGVFASIEARLLPPLIAADGVDDVRLRQSLKLSGDHLHDGSVKQEWVLQVRRDSVRPIDELTDTAMLVQSLVTIATGKSADFENVTFEHPTVTVQHGDRTLRSPFDYHVRWSRRSSEAAPVERHEMFFDFDSFGGTDALERWLPVAREYSGELGRIMATRGPNTYLEDQIMNISAALESFDKKRRQTGDEDVFFRTRVTETANFAGPTFLPLINGNLSRWSEIVRDRRNDLAHHRQDLKAVGLEADLLLSEQLFWLMATCLLRLSGAPDSVFEKLSAHRHIQWLHELASQQ